MPLENLQPAMLLGAADGVTFFPAPFGFRHFAALPKNIYCGGGTAAADSGAVLICGVSNPRFIDKFPETWQLAMHRKNHERSN